MQGRPRLRKPYYIALVNSVSSGGVVATYLVAGGSVTAGHFAVAVLVEKIGSTN